VCSGSCTQNADTWNLSCTASTSFELRSPILEQGTCRVVAGSEAGTSVVVCGQNQAVALNLQVNHNTCSVVTNDGPLMSTLTITCTAALTAVLGGEDPCRLSTNGDGTSTLLCSDVVPGGTALILTDGGGCTATNDNNGCRLGGSCVGASGCEVGTEGCDDPVGVCGGCAGGTFCAEGEEGDAVCAGWPCLDINGDPDENSAFNVNTGECQLCNPRPMCAAEGETGRLWPFTLNTGRCICETQTGYYADVSLNGSARACDADGDGWVRSAARGAIESNDQAMRDNARCTVRTIDRFELQNEYGQSREVFLCVNDETVSAAPCVRGDSCGDGGRCFGTAGECGESEEGCTCGCLERAPISLYESVKLDDNRQLDGDIDTPQYGERRLGAVELNGLTRACVSATADFNDNSISDVNEYHGNPVLQPEGDPVLRSLNGTFAKFAYFIELHQGWFARVGGEAVGRYVIAERSRCGNGFPVKYDDVLDGDYWRECTRNRDSEYDSLTSSTVGFDFAQFSCGTEAETCPLPAPLALAADEGSIPAHGLCDLQQQGALPPADGVWRGMNHHSQFKCALIDPTAAAGQPQSVARSALSDELGTDGQGQNAVYQFNSCSITGAPVAPSITPPDSNANPSGTNITCTPLPRSQVTTDDVGFVSVRYNDVGYTKGCINEWAPSSVPEERLAWRSLCPGYAETSANFPPNSSSSPVRGQGNVNDFGRITCGCGLNYGGPGCDLGCAQPHLGGTLDNTAGPLCSCADLDDPTSCYCSLLDNTEPGGRTRGGYWMCGDVDAVSTYSDLSAPPVHSGGGYTLSGSVPSVGFIQAQPMCAGDDCDTGYSIMRNIVSQSAITGQGAIVNPGN
ncbi:MAG: hypothetical protein AAFS10_09855, partial [Myxococcota bacterium]